MYNHICHHDTDKRYASTVTYPDTYNKLIEKIFVCSIRVHLHIILHSWLDTEENWLGLCLLSAHVGYTQ